MRNVWIAPVFLISAVLGISPDASAQSASTPDLSGVWAPAANLDHFSTEEPSFTPWAAERYRAAREGTTMPLEQGREDVDPMLHPYCMVPGYPRIYIRPSPIEIGHTSDRVYVLFEVNNQWRIIYMDGRTHPESAPPTFMGHSVGRWDGDTLVSETVGLNELTWLDSLGTPHSDVLRVEERIREGQLDECPLTLSDLDKIKAQFARILDGVYHRRVEYPNGVGAEGPNGPESPNGSAGSEPGELA